MSSHANTADATVVPVKPAPGSIGVKRAAHSGPDRSNVNSSPHELAVCCTSRATSVSLIELLAGGNP